jgi:molecular chaperone DnaK
MVYTADKTLRDLGDKVTADVKSNVETCVGKVKKALEGTDIEAIQKATEELGAEVQKIGASVYQQQAQAASAGPGPSETPETPNPEQGGQTSGRDDVVDGEFKSV